MPITFPVSDPNSPLYIRFARDNKQLLGGVEEIDRIEWINPKNLGSSIIVHLLDADSANRCIKEAVCFQGRMLPCEKSRRFPPNVTNANALATLPSIANHPPLALTAQTPILHATAPAQLTLPATIQPPASTSPRYAEALTGPQTKSFERPKAEQAFLKTNNDYLPPGLAY